MAVESEMQFSGTALTWNVQGPGFWSLPLQRKQGYAYYPSIEMRLFSLTANSHYTLH